jgi:hypothetical protein
MIQEMSSKKPYEDDDSDNTEEQMTIDDSVLDKNEHESIQPGEELKLDDDSILDAEPTTKEKKVQVTQNSRTKPDDLPCFKLLTEAVYNKLVADYTAISKEEETLRNPKQVIEEVTGKIFITSTASDGRIRFLNLINAQKFAEITNDLTKYMNGTGGGHHTNGKTEDSCTVKLDGLFYRATVLATTDDDVFVNLIDAGLTYKVHESRVFITPTMFACEKSRSTIGLPPLAQIVQMKNLTVTARIALMLKGSGGWTESSRNTTRCRCR